jgi:hypothetical protein
VERGLPQIISCHFIGKAVGCFSDNPRFIRSFTKVALSETSPNTENLQLSQIHHEAIYYNYEIRMSLSEV